MYDTIILLAYYYHIIISHHLVTSFSIPSLLNRHTKRYNLGYNHQETKRRRWNQPILNVADRRRQIRPPIPAKSSRSQVLSSHDDIEPYVGPVGSLTDMEGGISISELALNVMTGPSLVANGRGLFLCIYNDIDDETDETESTAEEGTSGGGAVEEIILPQGTPLCGYARGYFTNKYTGDKSVGFQFAGDAAAAAETAVFYNKELVTLGDAIWSVYRDAYEWKDGVEEERYTTELLKGHRVDLDRNTGRVRSIAREEDYSLGIFVPEECAEDGEFSATSLGIYANDLAYDPDANELEYLENSEQNNILQLVWRMEMDAGGTLTPSWPVVITKKDVRMLNSVPMEVGLQYGYNYWDAVKKEGASKYISD